MTLIDTLHAILEDTTLAPWPARKTISPRLEKLRDVRKSEHAARCKPSGNGKIEVGRWQPLETDNRHEFNRPVEHHGKSSRRGVRERAGWWAQAYAPEVIDLNPDEGARVLVRSGFIASTMNSAYNRETSERLYAWDDGHVFFESKMAPVYCPALSAAVMRLCDWWHEMWAMDDLEQRILIDAYCSGDQTVMFDEHLEEYRRLTDEEYEIAWLAHLEAQEHEAREAEARGNTLRVVYNNDGTYDIDDSFGHEITF